MQGAPDFHNHITYTIFENPDGVFDNPTTFEAAVDVFNAYSATRETLIFWFLRVTQAATAWLLVWCDTATPSSV